jgi:hypothetical protein
MDEFGVLFLIHTFVKHESEAFTLPPIRVLNMEHKPEDNSKILLTMVTGFLVIALIAKKHEWLIYIPVGIGVVSVVSDTAANYIVKWWLKVAEVMGKINSRIILSAIFFLFLTPIAFLYKLSGKTKSYFKQRGESTFVVLNKAYTKSDLENMW